MLHVRHILIRVTWSRCFWNFFLTDAAEVTQSSEDLAEKCFQCFILLFHVKQRFQRLLIQSDWVDRCVSVKVYELLNQDPQGQGLMSSSEKLSTYIRQFGSIKRRNNVYYRATLLPSAVPAAAVLSVCPFITLMHFVVKPIINLFIFQQKTSLFWYSECQTKWRNSERVALERYSNLR